VTPNEAKLDILVNMAGQAPADAKALLSLLKEVEKTEKATQKEADALAREIDKAAKAAERLAAKTTREQDKVLRDMAREAEKVARELDKAEKAAARLEERNKRVADKFAKDAQREADKTTRKQASDEKAAKRQEEREKSERQQQYREVQRAKSERMQRGGAVARAGLSGNATGALSLAGGPAGMAVSAAVEGAEAGLHKLARAAEIAATANTTAAQRSRMVTEELIPMAGSVYRLSDAIKGVTQEIYKQNQQYTINVAGIEAAARRDSSLRAAGAEHFQQSALAAGHAGAPAVAYQSIDRGTVRGEHAYQEQERMLPAQTAERSARVNSEAARASAKNEAAKAAAIRARISELEAKRGTLNARLAGERQKENAGGGGLGAAISTVSLPAGVAYSSARGTTLSGAPRNQAGINAAAAAVQENEKEIAAQTAAYAEQAARAKEQGAAAAQSESQHRRTQLDLQRAELDVLKQREQRMASMQQAAGSMSRGEFAGSARALKLVQERGINNVSARTASRAAQIAPEFLAKERERLGGERMGTLAGAGMLGAEGFGRAFGGDFQPGQTLAETRQKIGKVAAEVQVKIQMDERLLAESIVKSIEPVMRAFRDIFDLEIRRIESEMRAAGVRQSNANNGAAR
jgi:hypothetical protein